MTKPSGLTLFLLLASLCLPASAIDLQIAAANSTCNALKAAGRLFEQQNQVRIEYQCKSSGRLAKGLNGGTISTDIYISANRAWMDYMIENGLVQADAVITPWGNELIVATSSNSDLAISDWLQLKSDQVQSILIGDPSTAPFGRYAKQAMVATAIWEDVKMKISTRKHITLLAETLAESPPDSVGILFATNITDAHRKLFAVDKAWHPAIRYYVAPLESAAHRATARAFLSFLDTPEAKEIFRQEKFLVDG